MSNIMLSIIIPAKNEEWLPKTLEDLLEHIKGKTEIIVVLDGWERPIPPLPSDPRIMIIRHSKSIGQRAASNEAARLALGKYVMKIDAHVATADGFDVSMLQAFSEVGDEVVMAPLMKNLHVFDWVCDKGHHIYQGKSGPCREYVSAGVQCGAPTHKEVIWYAKPSPNNFSYCFDSEPHFQYFGQFEKTELCRNGPAPEINISMSLQGSCFMCTKELWFKLDICSEDFPSWGSQGIEVACKTWLSGRQVLVNRRTWYAHLFRTQGGDFGFPYHQSQSDVEKAKAYARHLFFDGTWPQMVKPLSWLVEKFWPVKGWTDEDLASLKAREHKPTKGIIYYTDNELDETIAGKVRKQLLKANLPIVSASLKPLDFGLNLSFIHGKRGYLQMHQQILSALENSTADIIFFCEHDVLYHPSHFEFVPPDRETFCYNQNVWLLRMTDGHGLHYDVNQLSGLCAYREILITHFREKLEYLKKKRDEFPDDGEFNKAVRFMGFEPMTHHRVPWQNEYKLYTWKSPYPNVDLKHGANATGQRWKKEQYRNQKLLINWIENDNIPGWGHFKFFWKKV